MLGSNTEINYAPWLEYKILLHRLKIGSVTNGFIFYFQSH